MARRIKGAVGPFDRDSYYILEAPLLAGALKFRAV
jgi:hypothetical protein